MSDNNVIFARRRAESTRDLSTDYSLDPTLSSNYDNISQSDYSTNQANLRNRNSSIASSFKEQKKFYDSQKRVFAKKVLHDAMESSNLIHSGWLKTRTNFRVWSKVWCQVNPGLLILYRSQEAQKKDRLGVIVLSVCQVMLRPTNKEGFCFKLFSPFNTPIWTKASKFALSFSRSSLILRASDEVTGKLWLDVLQYGIKTANNKTTILSINNDSILNGDMDTDSNASSSQMTSLLNQTSASTSHGLNFSDLSSQNSIFNNNNNTTTILPTHRKTRFPIVAKHNGHPSSNHSNAAYEWRDTDLESVKYYIKDCEEFGDEGVPTGEIQEGNKNLLWHMIKRLRPGMDLSRVPLPVFILEPRSFLEKLSDYYFHCDLLTEVNNQDDALQRIIQVTKWYLSGFYKKPKGPKKPYNPILGERYRCYWDNPRTQSRTFFIAEQVSHHPPISAFHVTNRKDGYIMTGSLLSKSRFSGNSVSAIFEGEAKLHFINKNETYRITMPFANCKGILIGSLTLELGGKVEIECIETKCKCEIEFKLSPTLSLWTNRNSYNIITGKIFSNDRQTHSLEGFWDRRIDLIDLSTKLTSKLWEVTPEIRQRRLKCYSVSFEDQEERESERLWKHVSDALLADDEVTATEEKLRLEDMQRKEARERQDTFLPDHFRWDDTKKEWTFRWTDGRCWNSDFDIVQFEDNFKIKTLITDTKSNTESFNSMFDIPVSTIANTCQNNVRQKAQQLIVNGTTNVNSVNETSDNKSNSGDNNNNREHAIKESENKVSNLGTYLGFYGDNIGNIKLYMALLVCILSVIYIFFM